ncbi:A disintegrin and metalloproteinase with thrombospondin motifs 1-like [Penaeus chinensis]|uniref:A disintegrin and metalloproteinase with thrombospondin motifs 1-like n=1 Tax=Penaeus chinensis TaxID=139456 RepID=UPI001FB6904C|nr:A disintegrin and metalloproteinase with thrombospondin motifs 1-like [Penaeus chinensis]
MTSATHWSGLMAKVTLATLATTLAIWAIVANPGQSSSHLTLWNGDDAASSGRTAKVRRSSEEAELAYVTPAADSAPVEGGGGRGEGGRIYRWEAWGRAWAIRVWADSGFIAPSMLLRKEGVREARVVPPTSHARCFHTGVVLGAADSAVALNICDGLVRLCCNIVGSADDSKYLKITPVDTTREILTHGNTRFYGYI